MSQEKQNSKTTLRHAKRDDERLVKILREQNGGSD